MHRRPLRGRNPQDLKAGAPAILFVRPESLKLGKGEKDATITSSVLNVAFEGNASHIFLKGAGMSALWPQYLALALIGASVLVLAARRFHKTAA